VLSGLIRLRFSLVTIFLRMRSKSLCRSSFESSTTNITKSRPLFSDRIDYAEVEKHLLEERTLEGLAYAEFIDARDAELVFVLSPTEIRQIVRLVRSLSQQSKFGPTAVLVSTDFAFGIMRAMEMLLEDITDVRPFRHESLARSRLASASIGPGNSAIRF
jgi:hypothetical protein